MQPSRSALLTGSVSGVIMGIREEKFSFWVFLKYVLLKHVLQITSVFTYTIFTKVGIEEQSGCGEVHVTQPRVCHSSAE